MKYKKALFFAKEGGDRHVGESGISGNFSMLGDFEFDLGTLFSVIL